jgi:hypothetical protein
MRWSDTEVEILSQNASLPIEELEKLLPGRSSRAILAKRLRTLPERRKLKQWSRDERHLLARLVQEGKPLAEIYSAFPTRTESAIRSQISYLRQRQWNV